MKTLVFRIWFSIRSDRECFLTSVAMKMCLLFFSVQPTITCQEERDGFRFPQRNIENQYIGNFFL